MNMMATQDRVWSIPRGTSRGVEELAKWMIDHPRELIRLHLRIGRDVVERLLDGDLVPDDEMAEQIGVVTAGRVTGAMFGEPGLIPPDVDPADLACGACEAVLIAATPKGVLGETPSGPLFGAVRDGDAIEVHGPGLSFRVSGAAAQSLYDALSALVEQPGLA